MSDFKFRAPSTFKAEKGFTQLKIGENKPVLDVEFNEMQEIQNHKRNELAKTLYPNGFMKTGQETFTYVNGVATLSNAKAIVDGDIITIDTVSISVANGNRVYLKVWEQEVSSTSTIKKHGNQTTGGTTIANDLVDSRINLETARRIQKQYTVVTTAPVTAGVTYIPVGLVRDNQFIFDQGYVEDIASQLSQGGRAEIALNSGTSVINSKVNALGEVEFQGSTLVSLGNSILEGGKQYVIADKKVKIAIDGQTVSGVSKFTKGSTTQLNDVDFVNKYQQLTDTNPNIAYARTGLPKMAPSEFSLYELSSEQYSRLARMEGTLVSSSTRVSGYSAQQLFSFDLIAEIERTLGIIPGTTKADKNTWLIDNLDFVQPSWVGYGTSVGGPKATLSAYDAGESSYIDFSSHDKTTPTELSSPYTGYLNSTSLGFIHILVSAEPSDGVLSSIVYTDYVKLSIKLKDTARLITRPQITVTGDLEGKVSGSTVENPHMMKHGGVRSTLYTPTEINALPDLAQRYYDLMKYPNDGKLMSINSSTAGTRPQQVLCFNVIEEIERSIGKIPNATTLAQKVAWAIANVEQLDLKWTGYASYDGRFKANLLIWFGNMYSNLDNIHTNGTPKELVVSANASSMDLVIRSDGYAYATVHGEITNGAVPSVLFTSYISMDVKLKRESVVTNSNVALYEVTPQEYNNILTTWDEQEVLKRYPRVEGIQHLNGVGVIATNGNLIPPFSKWTLGSNAIVKGAYELEQPSTAVSSIFIDVLPNTLYNISLERVNSELIMSYTYCDKALESLGIGWVPHGTNEDVLFTPPNTTKLKITAYLNTANVTASWKNLMLSLGAEKKPFEPYNPSYVYADVQLGSIGENRDTLYKQDGRWYVRKVIEKDVALKGSLDWSIAENGEVFRKYRVALQDLISNSTNIVLINTKGEKAGATSAYLSLQPGMTFTDASYLVIPIANTETGITTDALAVAPNIKRFFNGWKYTNGTTWTSVTGNGQTATAQVALDTSPTDYKPFMFSYLLKNAQVLDVTDKVEGSLRVTKGQSQIDVLTGLITKEVVTPVVQASNQAIYINYKVLPASMTAHPVERFLAVYKNGVRDEGWLLSNIANTGNETAVLTRSTAKFDPTAEYTVTYVPAEKKNNTASIGSVKLFYAQSLRNTIDDVIAGVQDNTAQLSFHENVIVDLYVRLKALEVE